MSDLRIHRYVIKEITIPTLLSLLIFTCVLLMGKIPKIVELIINNGVPAGQIFQLFSYLLPTFFTITLPLSFLLGILLAFGRLSADSEFIALKASGVSLYNLVKPVFVLALFFSLLTAWITISIEPASKAAFRTRLFQTASSSASISVKPGVFNDKFKGIVIHTQGMDENSKTMQDVFISDAREGTVPATITAQHGHFISDPNKSRLTLRLSNGSIHRQPIEGKKSPYQILRFTSYDINIDLGNQLGGRHKRRQKEGELSWNELNRAIDMANNDKRRRSLENEKYERIVIAFAPIVLLFVGIPLGLQSNRSGKGSGFALALVIFLAYYILLSLANTIAEKGVLPAAVILWFPNFCFLLGGVWSLHSTAVEKPLWIIQFSRWLIRELWPRGNKSGKDL